MLESIWISFFINFCWSIVALQCCVGFLLWSTVNQPYEYTCPSFSRSAQRWAELPVLCSGFSSVTYFIQSRACVSISISQLTPLPFPPWYSHVCSLHLRLYFWKASEFLTFKALENEMQKFTDLSQISPPACSNWRSTLNHSSIIYNNSKMEATQGSTDGWLVKRDTYIQKDIIQPSKGKNHATCYSRNGLGDMTLGERSQTQKNKYCDSPYVRNLG